MRNKENMGDLNETKHFLKRKKTYINFETIWHI